MINFKYRLMTLIRFHCCRQLHLKSHKTIFFSCRGRSDTHILPCRFYRFSVIKTFTNDGFAETTKLYLVYKKTVKILHSTSSDIIFRGYWSWRTFGYAILSMVVYKLESSPYVGNLKKGTALALKLT